MWLITNRGLLSVVQDFNDASTLIVRARQDGFLEELMEEAGLDLKAWKDESADYPYRVKMSRHDFANILCNQVFEINYPNFKESVTDPKLKRLLSNVWSTLSALGTGKFYGLGGWRRKRSWRRTVADEDMCPEEAFLQSLPDSAFLEDGTLDPDYVNNETKHA